MEISTKDYENALELFLKDLHQLGDALISIMTYGSMARGDIRPGLSDIDICVILRDEVFEHKTLFLNTLDILTNASARLAQSGLPFQPCLYFRESEICSINAQFSTHWKLGKSNKVIFGKDIRVQIDSTSISQFAARMNFFEGRRILHPLVLYLNKETLTKQQCQTLISDLLHFKKVIPTVVCNAFNAWPDTVEAINKLEELLPDLDRSVFNKIDLVQVPGGLNVDPKGLQSLLKEALVFMELVNDRLVSEA